MFGDRKYEYGPTGGLFDFDRDGKLDFFEKTREYEFMESFLKDDDDEDDDNLDLDDELDYEDDEDDDDDEDENEDEDDEDYDDDL